MKIVTFDEFNQMPAGTIFAPWEPCVYLEPFKIKTDTGEWVKPNRRFFDQKEKFYMFNGVLDLAPDVPVTKDCGTFRTTQWTWDGDSNDYRDYSLFAILEPYEVDRLTKALEWAKSGCQGEWSGDKEDG